MLSKRGFEDSINLLKQAMNWRLTDDVSDAIFLKIRGRWEDDLFGELALEFCDRGTGTLTNFLHYIRAEKLRRQQTGEVIKALPPAPVNRNEPPPDEQIRCMKLLALMSNGHGIAFDDVAITDDDRQAAATAVANQGSILETLKLKYKKIGSPSTLSADLIAAVA